MSTFQPSDTLRSRTFLGLLVAQFLAAFNDQAIHASAMFFAIHQQTLSKADAISLMPILFYAPWAIFCTVAGYLADRYSKRSTLVFWKVAEVFICLIATTGFWIGTHSQPEDPWFLSKNAGSWLVLSCVFLMGMHSAFFVPAKYGAMPEILTPRMLSRGNGVLESLSFLAVILGTVVGGVLSFVFHGQEQYIGLILLTLALIGAFASFFIARMPAANPTRAFPAYIYKPLFENIRVLLSSRPLALAVVGIAFFTFLVAFMRVTVYMHGESQVPRWTEMKTSLIVGMVALGIGLGSPLVGFLSGGKVELGLVPIGALGMIVATVSAAASLTFVPGLVACVVFIGFFTGFYLVPLFTLLQHRAPKTSKGDSIATSNFINVTGAILSSVLFSALVWLAHHSTVAPSIEQEEVARGKLLDLDSDEFHTNFHYLKVQREGEEPFVVGQPEEPRKESAWIVLKKDLFGEGTGERQIIEADERGGLLIKDQDVVVTSYKRVDAVHNRTINYYRVRPSSHELIPVYEDKNLPSLLFLGAGGMTLITLMILWWQLPDLFFRTWLWVHIHRRRKLEIAGMTELPSKGPTILVTDADSSEGTLDVLSATDRTTRCLFIQNPAEKGLVGLIRIVAIRRHLGCVDPSASVEVWRTIATKAHKALDRSEVVALPLNGGHQEEVEKLLNDLLKHPSKPVILPVHHGGEVKPGKGGDVFILAGEALQPGISGQPYSVAEVRATLDELKAKFTGKAPAEVLAEAH